MGDWDNMDGLLKGKTTVHYAPQRRLQWMGHVYRLPRDDPARLCMESLPGQRNPWWAKVVADLRQSGIDPDCAAELSQDRYRWSSLTRARTVH